MTFRTQLWYFLYYWRSSWIFNINCVIVLPGLWSWHPSKQKGYLAGIMHKWADPHFDAFEILGVFESSHYKLYLPEKLKVFTNQILCYKSKFVCACCFLVIFIEDKWSHPHFWSSQKEWDGRVQEFKEKNRFTAEGARRILLDISDSASSGDYT